MELGAKAAINYQQLDFVQELDKLTIGQGVDVILDMIGGDYLSRNLKALAIEGRLVQIAIQHGAKSEINLWSLMLKRLTISGSTLRSRDTAFKAKVAQQLQHQVWPLLQQGRVRPVIDMVFPLAAANLAHERMSNNQHFGKIVLSI
jgi:NADPH:quinone reductase-like Zn-dependent oxidoreductase